MGLQLKPFSRGSLFVVLSDRNAASRMRAILPKYRDAQIDFALAGMVKLMTWSVSALNSGMFGMEPFR